MHNFELFKKLKLNCISKKRNEFKILSSDDNRFDFIKMISKIRIFISFAYALGHRIFLHRRTLNLLMNKLKKLPFLEFVLFKILNSLSSLYKKNALFSTPLSSEINFY
jgi:hypothetical protein